MKKSNTHEKKFINLLLALASFMLSFINVSAQCPPVLEGPHSMCSYATNPHPIYSITNFVSSATYNAYAIVNGNPYNFSVNGAGQFQVSLPNGATQAMIIIQVTAPCTGADTIWVQPCCGNDPPTANVLSDISSNQIPFIVQQGNNYVYNPTLYPSQPSTIVIHGQLTMTSVTEFYNCTILMDQGASFRIKNAKELVLINCTVNANCNKMWEGILCDDGSKFKIRQNTIIRDAQYGVNMTGSVIMDFWQSVQMQNCYVGVYAPPNTSGNTPNLTTAVPGQDLSITHNANLLQGFYGQNPTPQTGSYAGVLFYDVANFNTLNSANIFQLTVSNMNLGFVSIRGNLTIPYSYNATNIQPVIVSGSTHEYNWSNAYNGSGVYCQATTTVPRTLTIGNTTSQFTTLQNCKFGVNVNANMNLNCKYNTFQNMTGMGGVRVTSCASRTIDILHNNFSFGFYMGIHCASLANATLHIYNNTFNNGINYYPAIDPLGNTAIYLTNKGGATVVNGYINNNHITAARIGIYVSNTKGASSGSSFLIQNNDMNFNRTHATLYDFNYSTYWKHYGIWIESSENMLVSDNPITRSVTLTGSPSVYPTIMYGINVKLCKTNTIVKNNVIKDFGTCIKTNGNSNGTFYQCNTCSLTVNSPAANTQGYYFDMCSLLDQGSASSPSDNKWTGFGLGATPYRLAGTLNLVSNAVLDWRHRSTNNIYFATPASVTPVASLNVAGGATGVGPCIANVDGYDAIVEMVYRIVHNEIEYEIFPEESRYQDELWAFSILADDETLRNSNSDYIAFYEERVDDNIGDFHAVYDFMEEGEYQDALNRLNELIENNSIDYNLAFKLELAIQMEEDPERELTSAEITELTNIAWMTTWEGGEGVINARHFLGLEVDDVLLNLRLGSSSNPKDNSSTTISLEELNSKLVDSSKLKIKLFDSSGKLTFSGLLNDFTKNKPNFKNGIYSYKVFDNGSLTYSGKVIIVK